VGVPVRNAQGAASGFRMPFDDVTDGSTDTDCGEHAHRASAGRPKGKRSPANRRGASCRTRDDENGKDFIHCCQSQQPPQQQQQPNVSPDYDTIPFDSLTTPSQQQHYGRRQANGQAGTCATRDSDNQDETREESPCGGMTPPSALRSPVTLGKKRGTDPLGGGVLPALFGGVPRRSSDRFAFTIPMSLK
jgi:hypothetical protein